MTESVQKKKADEKARAEAETEVLADGTIAFLSPRYKYYEFSGPLATNLINSKKILTINISVAVYETPMKAEDFYETFEYFVPVLRSIVIKGIGDFTLEMAEDEPTIFQFRAYLLEAFNKKLRDLGAQPILKKVVFSERWLPDQLFCGIFLFLSADRLDSLFFRYWMIQQRIFPNSSWLL